MKIIIPFIFIIYIFSSCHRPQKSYNFEIGLDTGWVFKPGNDTLWSPVQVPGNLYTNKDLNIEIQEKKLNEITGIYKVNFDVPKEILNQDSIFLKFEGIAGKAEIYINGILSATSCNMFLPQVIPCKNQLKEFQNRLEIKILPLLDKNILKSFDNNISKLKCREALCLKGTEVNPPFRFTGIWKPVKLLAWSQATFTRVHFETLSISPDVAVIEATTEINSLSEGEHMLKFDFENEMEGNFPVHLKKGEQTFKFKLKIKNPRLWWCNGMGSQNLYEVSTTLWKDDKLISEKIENTGIRKIELIQQSDSIGYNFYFKLNNIPIFIKGATYLPIILNSPADVNSKTEEIISEAANANLNLFRVWGGGIYETDDFYNLCDKYGIMVWQDFPFSCNLTSETELQKFNIKKEITANTTRIENHPSLSIFFCNSDISTFADYREDKLLSKYSLVSSDCPEFFTEEMPQLLRQKSSIPFFSSCMAGKTKNLQNFPVKDWRVWYDSSPFSEYNETPGCFTFEYGMQSFPGFIAEEADMDTVSPNPLAKEISAYQFNKMPWMSAGMDGNQLIFEYMQMYYNAPINIEATVYLSQLLQAEAIKNAIESHRIHKPFCMGSILWHYNDFFSAITWSVTDDKLIPKAAWFTLKRSYKNLKVIPERNKNEIRLWAVNDSLSSFDGFCNIDLTDFDGKTRFSKRLKVNIQSQQLEILWLANEINFIPENKSNKLYLHVSLEKDNSIVDENILYFVDPKYLELPVPDISFSVEEKNGYYLMTTSSDRLAKNVMFFMEGEDITFSDNNIDMLPGRIYKIKIEYNGNKQSLEENLQIHSLIDTY
jgi:beta-mannosidase